MLIGLLLPFTLEGTAGWWELLREWVHSMRYHTEVMASPDRIGAILGGPFGLATNTLVDGLFIAAAGILLALFTWRNRGRHSSNRDLDRAFELWLSMSAVPNLVITDQQHFMFALPLLLFTLAWLYIRKDRPVLLGFLLALLLYATRSTDLWGSRLENLWVGWGVLGLGNILLMAVAWLAWRHWSGLAEKFGPARD
jgi:hypothetical protein